MSRRRRTLVLIVACFGLALLVAGAASAASGLVTGKPTPSSQVIESTTTSAELPEVLDAEVPTDDPSSSGETEGPDDPTATSSTEYENFGSYVSSMRHEGDHTPAAIYMGKDVPGWDPEKHASSTTTSEPADQGDDEYQQDGGDQDPALDGAQSGTAKEKKDKTVPGHSK